jgi:hypothetical protein
MFEEWNVKKIYSVTGVILLLGYTGILLSVDIIRPLSLASFESFLSIICLIVSWMPLIVLIILCLVYNINMGSNKYKTVRKYCYLSIVSYILSLFFLFASQNIFGLFNLYVVNAIIMVTGIINMLLHGKIAAVLIRAGFNFSHELRILRKVDKEIPQQARATRYATFLFLFILAYIVSHNFAFFLVSNIVVSIFLLRPLHEIVKFYRSITEIIVVNPTWIYVNYVVSVSLAMFSYVCFSSMLPFLICIYSGSFLVFVFNLKYARHVYAKVEKVVE